jgi:hypothetical protein
LFLCACGWPRNFLSRTKSVPCDCDAVTQSLRVEMAINHAELGGKPCCLCIPHRPSGRGEGVGCAEWAKWGMSADGSSFSNGERHAPIAIMEHTIVQTTMTIRTRATHRIACWPASPMHARYCFGATASRVAAGRRELRSGTVPVRRPIRRMPGLSEPSLNMLCSLPRSLCGVPGHPFTPSFSAMMKPSYAFGCRHQASPHC